MKVTIKKTIFFMAIALIGVACVIFESVVKFFKIPVVFPILLTISVLLSTINLLAILHLIFILKWREAKKSAIVSVLFLFSTTAVLVIAYLAGHPNIAFLLTVSIVQIAAMFSVLIQTFRIIDSTLSTPFKLWSIILLFKTAAQFSLPLLLGFIADHSSFPFFDISFFTIGLEITPLGAIIFIFYKVLQELKNQQNITIKDNLAYIYETDQPFIHENKH